MLADRLGKLGIRERIGLVLAGLALMFLLLDKVVVQPVSQRYDAMNGVIAGSLEEYRFAAAVVETEAAVDREFGRVRAILGDPVPEVQMIDRMKETIDELVKKSDIQVVMMRGLPAKDMGHYLEYVVEIGEFECDEPGLISFLHAIQGGERTFRVSRLNIRPNADGKSLRGSMLISRIAIPGEFVNPRS